MVFQKFRRVLLTGRRSDSSSLEVVNVAVESRRGGDEMRIYVCIWLVGRRRTRGLVEVTLSKVRALRPLFQGKPNRSAPVLLSR